MGDVENEEVKLSDIGLIADKFWREILEHFVFVKLDEYVIMPNYVHGIIQIENGDCRNAPWHAENSSHNNENAPRRVPTKFGPLVKNSLTSIINHYKGNVKRCCNKNNFEHFAWQSRFYDRIIRTDEELNRIKQYIQNNPLKWELDRNNQQNLFM